MTGTGAGGAAVHPRAAREGGRDRNGGSFGRGGGGSTRPPPARGSSLNLTQRCAGVCGNRNDKYQEGRNCLHSLTLERLCPSHEELSLMMCLLKRSPFHFFSILNYFLYEFNFASYTTPLFDCYW